LNDATLIKGVLKVTIYFLLVLIPNLSVSGVTTLNKFQIWLRCNRNIIVLADLREDFGKTRLPIFVERI